MKKLDNTPADPRRTLELFMRGMFTHLITALARSLRANDLSVLEIAALHQIDRHGSLKIGDLAKIFDAPMQVASRTAIALVDKGLVERGEDPADRRVRTVALSAKGRAIIDKTSQERVGAAVAAAAQMPGDVVGTVGNAMQQMIAATEPKDHGGPKK